VPAPWLINGTSLAACSANPSTTTVPEAGCRRNPEALKMLPTRVRSVTAHTWAVLSIFFIPVNPANAADYTVKSDGSGNFRTIQACVDAAVPGDTCLVSAGTYDERVTTKTHGTASGRITFRAQGTVTMKGFAVRHAYITVYGFDVPNSTTSYPGQIQIEPGGSHCVIEKNTLRDAPANVNGIYFIRSSGAAANNCVVRGNTIRNVTAYMFLTLDGDNHLIEGNTFSTQNGGDYIRLFGANSVIRRNIFWQGSPPLGGQHPDVFQTFGGAGLKSENHVIEENYIGDLLSAFSQFNSGDGVVANGILYDNVKNITFRRNIIANLQSNASLGLPGLTFENNTFYRCAYDQAGLVFSGSLTRGYHAYATLKNNLFLACGNSPSTSNDTKGFYDVPGFLFTGEVISILVTGEKLPIGTIATGIANDMIANGYIDGIYNGNILAAARALQSIDEMRLDSQYDAYKSALWNRLQESISKDNTARTTFVANYNYVAGSASAGFPAKRSSGCVSGATYTRNNFCEPNGINGGNPSLANLNNHLGPDGIPFTLDDGLKPLSTSPICGKGEGGRDIGAYSCDPTKVFPDGGGAQAPTAPTNLQIIR
jgi:hypothetical protein